MMAYVTELQAIWTQIDYTIKDRLYKFLMGLNIEYEPLRSQILNREKVPTMKSLLTFCLKKKVE